MMFGDASAPRRNHLEGAVVLISRFVDDERAPIGVGRPCLSTADLGLDR
jgi:hypothetical protein